MGGPLSAPYDGHDMVETVARLLEGLLDSLGQISE